MKQTLLTNIATSNRKGVLNGKELRLFGYQFHIFKDYKVNRPVFPAVEGRTVQRTAPTLDHVAKKEQYVKSTKCQYIYIKTYLHE